MNVVPFTAAQKTPASSSRAGTHDDDQERFSRLLADTQEPRNTDADELPATMATEDDGDGDGTEAASPDGRDDRTDGQPDTTLFGLFPLLKSALERSEALKDATSRNVATAAGPAAAKTAAEGDMPRTVRGNDVLAGTAKATATTALAERSGGPSAEGDTPLAILDGDTPGGTTTGTVATALAERLARLSAGGPSNAGEAAGSASEGQTTGRATQAASTPVADEAPVLLDPGSGDAETGSSDQGDRDDRGGRGAPAAEAARTSAAAGPAATAQPMPGAGPGAQFLDALGSDAVFLRAARSAVASADAGKQAPGGIQSLTIQLKPYDLGTVTANLKMDGDNIAIEIEVDTAEAHRRLSDESASIVKALKGHGIVVDQVTILQPANQAGGQPAGRDGAPGGGAQAQQFQADGNGGQAGGRSQNQDTARQGNGQQAERLQVADRSAAGGGNLYI
jgi:flagellar hook-length control protein FliK